jgi:hypothetical protein
MIGIQIWIHHDQAGHSLMQRQTLSQLLTITTIYGKPLKYGVARGFICQGKSRFYNGCHPRVDVQ